MPVEVGTGTQAGANSVTCSSVFCLIPTGPPGRLLTREGTGKLLGPSDHFRQGPTDMKIGQKLQKNREQAVEWCWSLCFERTLEGQGHFIWRNSPSLMLSFSHLYWVSASKTFCYRTGKKYIFEYELIKTLIMCKQRKRKQKTKLLSATLKLRMEFFS